MLLCVVMCLWNNADTFYHWSLLYPKWKCESVSSSVMSNHLWLHGLQPTRLLCSWDSPGKNEYWSGQPFSSPGDLPDPGIKPGSPVLAGRFFTVWATREAPEEMLTGKWFAKLARKPIFGSSMLPKPVNYITTEETRWQSSRFYTSEHFCRPQSRGPQIKHLQGVCL